MSYYITKELATDFETAISKVTEALKQNGFGIISEIDIQKAMQEKLGKPLRPYKILGACNPNFAYQAIQAEEKIGLLLPCNVLVQQHDKNRTEVSAINPVDAMQTVENEKLVAFAEQIRGQLEAAINSL